MNILGIEPSVYRSTWRRFQSAVNAAGLTAPGDRLLLWRDLTGGKDWYEYPVPFTYFCTDPWFLGQQVVLRPPIRRELAEFWRFDANRNVHVFIAGIGTGKSFSGSLSILYALYLLSILKDPPTHLSKFPGVQLSPGSEVVAMNASAAGAEQAEKIVYGDTFTRLTESPYFKTYYPPEPNKESELEFHNRVRYSPGNSDWRKALGWNVFAFLVDEAAFGKQTERADYVKELFNALNMRRRSRFGALGYGGLLTSPNEEGAFVETVAGSEYPDPSVYVTRMTTWEAKEELQPGTGCFVMDVRPEAMRIHRTGCTFMREGVVTTREGEVVEVEPDQTLIVPDAYLTDFRADPSDALLKYGTTPQRARTPFITDVGAVMSACMLPSLVTGPRSVPRFNPARPGGEWRAAVSHPLESWLLGSLDEGMLQRRDDWAAYPWHIHIDPGLNRGRKGDAAGIAVGRIVDQAVVQVGMERRIVNRYVVPLVMQVIAPEGGEIFLSSLSRFVLELRALGIAVTSFSYDSFQSMEAIQSLTSVGLVTAGIKWDDDLGRLSGFGKPYSVDKSPAPYQEVKEALNEGRLLLPDYEIMRQELLRLEHRPGKSPDHPPTGSKDVADPVAGVVGYLAQHGHFVFGMPQTVLAAYNHPDQDQRVIERMHTPGGSWDDAPADLSID